MSTVATLRLSVAFLLVRLPIFPLSTLPSEYFTDRVDLTAPSGTDAPGDFPTLPLERNETFLRGGVATNDNGLVELTTIYPGYYEGRTAHIHTMVHLNWVEADNGYAPHVIASSLCLY